MKPAFSIRMKFLAVTVALLTFCTAVYLAVATTAIRKDKSRLVFDFNKNLVESLAQEIEEQLHSASDKLQLLAYLYGAEEKEQRDQLVSQLLGETSDMVWVGRSDDFQTLGEEVFHSERYIETYQLGKSEISSALKGSIPFLEIQKNGEAIWQVKFAGLPPLLGFGRSVVYESESGGTFQQYAFIALLRTDRFVQTMARSKQNQLFVVDSNSQILLSGKGSEEKLGVVSEVVKRSDVNKMKTNVMELELLGEKYLTGSSKAFGNKIQVVSLVSESKAFSIVDSLIRRSLHIALILVFLAFFAAYFFSSSLTKPIQSLLEGTKSVAMGDLNTNIQVKSHDEMSLLANSFNQMIGDLRESREKLEEINRNLEDKVKERTAELERQNQAVKSAQEALLRTTRLAAVGEMAGRAAHEVLNPLTSILSRVQKVSRRLESQGVPEIKLLGEISDAWEEDIQKGGFEKLIENWKQPSAVASEKNLWQEDLANIKLVKASLAKEWDQLRADTKFLMGESERINRIVQSMRGLSITKSDKQTSPLKGLLSNAVDVMADYASNHDTELSLKFPDKEILVSVDPDEFLQSLTNLIRNSVQAIVEKSLQKNVEDFRGAIEIAVSHESEIVRVAISDNGVGIENAHQTRLFDSQFSTKSRKEGTGLGLNISRRFIRAVGGDIVLLHSKPGLGSSFAIDLPIVKASRKEGSAA